MIKLQGSDKQIAWAEKIRTSNLNILNLEIKEMQTRLSHDTSVKESFDKVIAALQAGIERIENAEASSVESSAAWWIGHQNLANGYIYNQKQKYFNKK
jgi:hypothetical protein